MSKIDFFIRLAHKMPKIIIYCCANELLASVTTNELENKALMDVTAIEALSEYGGRYNFFERRNRKTEITEALP